MIVAYFLYTNAYGVTEETETYWKQFTEFYQIYLKTISLPPKIKGLWIHQFSNFASIKWGWDLHVILIHVRNAHDNEGKKKKKSSGEIVSGTSNTFIACHKNMTSYKMWQIY